jgi:hypothetical protein
MNEFSFSPTSQEEEDTVVAFTKHAKHVACTWIIQNILPYVRLPWMVLACFVCTPPPNPTLVGPNDVNRRALGILPQLPRHTHSTGDEGRGSRRRRMSSPGEYFLVHTGWPSRERVLEMCCMIGCPSSVVAIILNTLSLYFAVIALGI